MTYLDGLYIALGISSLLFVGAVLYVSIELVVTLKKLQLMISDFQNITQEIQGLKNSIKNTISQKIENITRSFFHRKEVSA